VLLNKYEQAAFVAVRGKLKFPEEKKLDKLLEDLGIR
jgi:hypothetical protein